MPSDAAMVSVVIPVYRSEAYLARTVAEVVAFLSPKRPFEIVLVNDGSPDNVQQVIAGLATQDPRVRFIELGTNGGQHAAILRGFAECKGDVVLTLDDDGQNPPASGWACLEELERKDLDVCYGRFAKVEQHGVRKLASAMNGWLTQQTLGNRSDVTLSNVRALRGDLARALGQAYAPFPYIDAMLFRSTRRIGDTPVEQRPRDDGASTYSTRKLVTLWISHLTSLTTLPLKAASFGCFGASVFGLVLGIAQLVRVLISQKAPPGWLSLFLAVTFLFSLLFAFL
ncbi:MAG: glycosyltransferase, partial [Deltaproteobacteria bacterium]|nr:glycosyltransferase [Deltaproteobacteria bacterium]